MRYKEYRWYLDANDLNKYHIYVNLRTEYEYRHYHRLLFTIHDIASFI